MAVKLLGLPQDREHTILYQHYEGVRPSEYFRSWGKEIRNITDLRNNPLLLIQPSGNSFIYRMLSWILRSPLTDADDKAFVPLSKLCPKTHKSGQRCIYEDGHKSPCKALVFEEF